LTETAFQERVIPPGAPPQPANDTGKLFPRFVWDGDRVAKPPEELIEDTIGERSVAFLGGQSGAGKSFVMMEMSRCLMTGDAFFGRKVSRRVGVAVLAPEGDETLDGRLEALRRTHALPQRLPFAYLGEVPDLKKDDERDRIVVALRDVDARMRRDHGLPLGIVFFDTLVASFDLADENDNSEASKTIRQMKEIRTALGITVVPVHHFGKGAETGLRGASGWRAGTDQLLTVTADRNEVTGDCQNRQLNVGKNRNGAEGPIAPFDLEFVTLGQRDDGRPWGTLVVVPRLDQPTTGRTGKRLSGTRAGRVFDIAFENAILSHGEDHRTFGGTGGTVRAVPVGPLKDAFFSLYQTGTDDPLKTPEQNAKTKHEAKKKAFGRAMNSLPAGYASDQHAGVERIWKVTP
jgi:hypothetical protein